MQQTAFPAVCKGQIRPAIDCTAVENEGANSMYQRSELDWLIYRDLLAYAERILNGDIANYPKKASVV